MNGRSRNRRWHIWLAWVAAIPILLWTISGLVMVARPIEDVRGEGLLNDPAPIRMIGPPIPPLISGVAARSSTGRFGTSPISLYQVMRAGSTGSKITRGF